MSIDQTIKAQVLAYLSSGGMLRDASHLFKVHRATIWRWLHSKKGAAGTLGSVPDRDGDPARNDSDRDVILRAMRLLAVEGSVPAAKLVLSNDVDPIDLDSDLVTVESAVQLLREWHEADHCSSCPGRDLRPECHLQPSEHQK